MTMHITPAIEGRHIAGSTPLISPQQLKEELPLTKAAFRTVTESRTAFERILRGEDDRFIFGHGGCSIHDMAVHVAYTERTIDHMARTDDVMLTLERLMVAKPRSRMGYMGALHDPFLDGSGDINEGLRLVRKMALHSAEAGVGIIVELLDPKLEAQYLSDLITLGILGARSVADPAHRHMASGMSMPIGNKNDTHGNVDTAIDAVVTERHGHPFVGVDDSGLQSIFHTTGNPYTFVILRGGNGPNYYEEVVKETQAKLVKEGLEPNVMVDTNHGNSGKDYTKQRGVFLDVAEQAAKAIRDGGRGPIGTMTESMLVAGSQSIPKDPKDIPKMVFGQSVTDASQSMDTTEEMSIEAAVMFRSARRSA